MCILFCAAVDDLGDVVEYLADLPPNKMKALGLQLGLLPGNLDKQGETPGDYNMKVMEAWLLKKDNVKIKGVPKWSVLVAALRKKSVDCKVEAEKIEAETLSKGEH